MASGRSTFPSPRIERSCHPVRPPGPPTSLRELIAMRAKRVCLALLVACLAIARPDASSPKFFQAATQTEFQRGDVQNLSIDNRGQLVLGPTAELVYETAAPFLWTVVPGTDGSLFVGSGNEGRVFRIDADGKGAPFFDATELEVHAIAPAPMAVCTSARRLTAKSTKSTAKVSRRPSSIPARSTSGRSSWMPEGTCTPPLVRRGTSTRSAPTAKVSGSTRPRRPTPRRWCSTARAI